MKKLMPDPELEALIRELNSRAVRAAENAPEAEQGSSAEPAAGAPGAQPQGAALRRAPRFRLPEPTAEGRVWLDDLVRRARALHASDLLVVVGAPPTVRVNGRLQGLGRKALSAGATELFCALLVPAELRARIERDGTLDFSLHDPESGRLRCNVHRQRGSWSAAIRLLAAAAPRLEALQLPEGLTRFGELSHGLVLVTGPTGCGKSTTLAALIRRILERRSVHLITIEDPVEYEHDHRGSVVEHVEVGRDVPSFADALRTVLRQDPDVLLIGEMRDRESMSSAITAAETGHLVFSTLHTGDAPQTVHRILDSYPANQMDAVRAQLAVSLAGVISQQLLPRLDGAGRVPAVEVLVATAAVRNLVRQGRIEQLPSQITLERQAGMLELDRSLADLVRQGLVDVQEARCRARDPESFDRRIG